MLKTTLVSPKTFKIEEVPDASVRKGEVLIRIQCSGICGSDIHAYYGKHPFMSFPITMGHECERLIQVS